MKNALANRNYIEVSNQFKNMTINMIRKNFKMTGDAIQAISDLIYIMDCNYWTRDAVADHMRSQKGILSDFELQTITNVDLSRGTYNDFTFYFTLRNLADIADVIFGKNVIDVYGVWEKIKGNFAYDTYDISGSTGYCNLWLGTGYFIATKNRKQFEFGA